MDCVRWTVEEAKEEIPPGAKDAHGHTVGSACYAAWARRRGLVQCLEERALAAWCDFLRECDAHAATSPSATQHAGGRDTERGLGALLRGGKPSVMLEHLHALIREHGIPSPWACAQLGCQK